MTDPRALPSRSGLVVTPEGYGLCMVKDNTWAYFASVSPMEINGDDWNDAPHDCNASEPYPREGQRVVKVAFESPYEMAGTQWDRLWPDLCADSINRGDAPWLYDPGYGDTYPEPKSTIMAGVSLQKFRKLVREAGGQVYEARR